MANSPKPPKPVDPNQAAQAQATWSRFGSQTPFGSTRWEGTGADSRQVQELSPEMMELFGGARDIAMSPRERFQAPEGFGTFRDSLQNRMQDRFNQGRPVYQPTQTFGGTLGIGGGPGPGGGGPGGGDQQPIPEQGLPPQVQTPMSGGPQIAQQFGGAAPKPVGFGGDPGGSPGGLPYMGKPDNGVPGGGMGPVAGGVVPEQGIQPVGPDGKGLLGAFSNARENGSQTPWRDAFMGPAKPDGSRDFFRNMVSNGGPAGMLGAGLGGMLGNMMHDRQKPGQKPIDRQLGEIGGQFARPVGIGNDRPKPIPVDEKPQIGKPGPLGKPFAGGGIGKPRMRSNAGRVGASLRGGMQDASNERIRQAIADMRVHDFSGMQE